MQLDSANYTGATAVPWLQACALPFLLIFKEAEISGHTKIYIISALIIFTIYCFVYYLLSLG